MMKLAVPTNWKDELLSSLKPVRDSLSEIYGDFDLSSGSRPARISEIADHIRQIHSELGVPFYYIFDKTCLNNTEWTRSGQRKLNGLFDLLLSLKVDGVTVAIPYLAEMIKHRYPQLKVNAAAAAYINSVERARFWESLGADTLTLLPIETNRNPRLLKLIRNSIASDIRLVANQNCLYRCAAFSYHKAFSSHDHQEKASSGVMKECLHEDCSYKRIFCPSNLFKADWIRPEDLGLYEEIGINACVLIDNTMLTQKLVFILKAYLQRCHNGNLLELFPEVRCFGSKRSLADIFFIENSKLQGFADHFFTHNCAELSCGECAYCDNVSSRTLRTNDDQLRLLQSLKPCLNAEDTHGFDAPNL